MMQMFSSLVFLNNKLTIKIAAAFLLANNIFN